MPLAQLSGMICMYTEPEIDLFLTENVNVNTFIIFSSLLNLQDYSLYKKTIEYLMEYKISFFDLNNLVDGITDESVKEFLNEFDNTFFNHTGINYPIIVPPPIDPELDPPLPLPPPVFNANSYLFGITSGFNFVYNQYKDFVKLKNENSSPNRLDYSLKITYGGNIQNVYSSESSFISEFNDIVLPLVLSDMGVADIATLFPVKTSFPVASTSVSDIRDKYDSVFRNFLSVLSNSNLYKLIIQRNENLPEIKIFDQHFYHLMNFDERNGPISTMVLYQLHLLSSQNEEYSEIQRDEFETEYHDIRFDRELSTSFAMTLFYYNIVKLIDSVALDTVDELYLEDLNSIASKIDIFKQLISSVYKHSKENLSKLK